MARSDTAKQVAQWMAARLRASRVLYQADAAAEILGRFGDDVCRYNDQGNLCIAKAVLDEFKKLTKDEAVWSRSDKHWRLKDPTDGPGRRAD
jgi:hypothetical protein